MTDHAGVVVPDGWVLTNLGALGRYINGRGFKSSEWSKVGRPIVRIQDLTGSNRNPHFFDGEVEDRFVVNPGEFLISWSATLGAYIWDGPQAVLNQHIFKVESKIDKRFHYHLVRRSIADLQSNAHGSGMVHVTKGVFERTPVAIPSDELIQRRIADVIDTADRSQMSAARHLETAAKAIERFRQAVLAAACSGRLTTEWREANPDLSGNYSVKAKTTVVPLVETPEEWSWCSLDQIAELKGGLQKGAKLKPGEPTRELPYLRVANVQRGWLDLSEMKTIAVPEGRIAALRLEKDDILFNEGGDRDKLGRGWIWEGQIDECVHQNHVFRARLLDEWFEPRFFSWFGNSVGASYFLDKGKQTVNLASLNMSTLKALPVPVPSPAEQSEIVRQVSRLFELADRLATRIQLSGVAVDRSAQAVLAKVFRGELADRTGASIGLG